MLLAVLRGGCGVRRFGCNGLVVGSFFLGRSRGAAACSSPRSRSLSTACPPLSFWAAVVAGGSGARGGVGFFVVRWCHVARAMCWPCWVAWCALLHLSCCVRGGLARHCVGCVPTPRAQEACHTRAAQHAAFACACLLWRCAFLCLCFRTWRCCAFLSGWGQEVREGHGARTFSLLCAQMLYSCIPTHLMRSAGLIVLVRAFFAALQPHPRVSGAVGGVSQLSCACLPCCPPTASPRQWGCGGGSQQGWDIAAVHSLGCARAHGPGEQLSIRCSVCAGPISRWARGAPLLHLVARARESARATAGPLTL